MALDKDSHKKIKEELYDYGSITDRDKMVVEEIIKYTDSVFADFLRKKFELKEREVYETKNHPFTKVCEELKIPLTLNGFEGGVGVDDIRYPIYSMCEDFRTFEKLYSAIVDKTINELRPHLKSNTVIDTK